MPLKYSKNWIILRTAINTKARDKSIQEILYFVSFMKLRATEAAIICSTIEITRAISLIMAGPELSYKNINYPWVSGTGNKTKKISENDLLK